MTQPIPSSLVARAASSYLKPAANKPSATAAAERPASPLPGRNSGTDFVIELSTAAKQHLNGLKGDAWRNQAQRLNGGQTARNVDDDILVDGVREAREPQTMSKEKGVEEEIVEAARVAHHVDDAAPSFECLQARNNRFIERKMLKETFGEEAEKEIEAFGHRRRGQFDGLHLSRLRRFIARLGLVRHSVALPVGT